MANIFWDEGSQQWLMKYNRGGGEMGIRPLSYEMQQEPVRSTASSLIGNPGMLGQMAKDIRSSDAWKHLPGYRPLDDGERPRREYIYDDEGFFQTDYKRPQAPPTIVDPRQQYRPSAFQVSEGSRPPPQMIVDPRQVAPYPIEEPIPEMVVDEREPDVVMPDESGGRITPPPLDDGPYNGTYVEPPPPMAVDPYHQMRGIDDYPQFRRAVANRRPIRRTGMFSTRSELMREAINRGLLGRLGFRGFQS